MIEPFVETEEGRRGRLELARAILNQPSGTFDDSTIELAKQAIDELDPSVDDPDQTAE